MWHPFAVKGHIVSECYVCEFHAPAAAALFLVCASFCCDLLCSLQGAAASYNSIPMAGWLWWAYNENSGDT